MSDTHLLSGQGIDLLKTLTNVEKQLIQRAMTSTKGNVAQASKLLTIHRTTLIYKLKKYQMTAKEFAL